MKKKLINFDSINTKIVVVASILLVISLWFLWNDKINLICYLDESLGNKVSSKNSSNEKIIHFYKYQKKVTVFDVRGESKFTNLEVLRGQQVIKSTHVSHNDNTLYWGINQFIENVGSSYAYIENNEVNRSTGYLTQSIFTNKPTAQFVWSCSEKKKLF